MLSPLGAYKSSSSRAAGLGTAEWKETYQMRNRFSGSMTAIATAGVIAGLWLVVKPTSGQGQAYRAPRTADGRPNLNGIWQALNTANWDIQDHAAGPAPFP